MGVREYAENELGVHRVYEQTEQLLDERKNLCAELDTKRREYFTLKHAISERELEVVTEQYSVEHGSATARKEATKDAIAADTTLRQHRLGLEDVRADIDGIEDDLKGTDLAIQANLARMQSLGGLLQLYAATKMGPRT